MSLSGALALLAYAILVPSGDHVGANSFAAVEVRRLRSPVGVYRVDLVSATTSASRKGDLRAVRGPARISPPLPRCWCG
jgi:hypothetical protein